MKDDSVKKTNNFLNMILMTVALACIVGGGVTAYADKMIEKKVKQHNQKIEKALENIAMFLESQATQEQVRQFKNKKQNSLKSEILGKEWKSQ